MTKGKIFIGIMSVVSMTITGTLGMSELHDHRTVALALGIVGIMVTAIIAVFGKPLAGDDAAPKKLADTIDPNASGQ